MIVLGFDTETTGLDVATDQIIQIGAVLWDTDAKTKHAKQKLDVLLKHPEPRVKIQADAFLSHGITEEDIDTYGVNATQALKEFSFMAKKAQYLVSHNGGPFDVPLYRNNCERLGIKPVELLNIDTACDIEYAPTIVTRKLVYLAAEHGFINPFPHDAVSDVLTMLQVGQRYDWAKAVIYAKAPTLVVRAETTFQQKELAKKQNFRWDALGKQWIKSVKDFQLEETKKAAHDAGFKITVLKKEGAK